MAVDKKTLLRDAQKQVQGGKFDKAVDSYRAIVKLDPRDAAVKNSLGDLLAKMGKKKEAVAEFLEVAAMYEKDGFAARAIAMSQKAITLDPEMVAVRVKLGDLNASLKLPAEGRTHYMQAAAYYEKKGEVANALEIFRKIANLDPDNLPVRVKLAAMFEKQKFPGKAAEEYVRAAQGYAAKKEMDTAVQLYVRAFKISPANSEARRRLADFYAQRQDWSVVVGLLETPVAKGSRDTEILVLYAEALTRVNHPLDAIKVLEGAQAREPNSVPVNLGLGRAYLKADDTEKGVEAINRCVSAHLAENRLELAESLLREMAEAAPDDDKIFQRVLEVAQKRGEKGAIAKAYLKLVAVYEKKNLVRSATGALEKYLEINPGDTAATQRLALLQAQAPAPKVEVPPPPPPQVEVPPPHDKAPPPPEEEDVVEISLEEESSVPTIDVGDEEELLIEIEGEGEDAPAPEITSVAQALASVRQGAPGKASEFLEEHLGGNPDDVDAWQALIAARRQLGESHGVRDALLRLASLHRRAARFDEARDAYKGALDADPRSTAAVRGLADLIAEEDAAAAPPPVEPPPAVSPAAPPEVEEEIAIDLLDQEAPEAEAEPEFLLELEPELVPATAPEPAPEPALEPAMESTPEPAPVPEPEPEPTFDHFFGDVEEVSLDEPAAEVLPPTRPAFEEFPEEAVAAPSDQPAAQPEFEEFTLDNFVDETAGPERGGVEPPPPVAPAPPATAVAPGETGEPAADSTGEFEEFLAEADFYSQQGLVDEAEFLYTKLLRLSPGHPVVTAQLRKLEEMRAPAAAPAPAGIVNFDEELDLAFGGEAPEPVAQAPPPPSLPAPDLDAEVADFSDFLTGLGQDLESQPVLEPPRAAPPQTGEEGLSEIFQEFQRSVKEQLGDEDFETHYNLGIAYKEMGLMDEAVAEFALAEKSPVRRLNAVSMIALCLREMGRFDEAALKLRTGISLAVEGGEDQKGFLYDLAALHEQAGRVDEAREALQRLLAVDPGYRDVAARVGGVTPAASVPPRKKSKVSYI